MDQFNKYLKYFCGIVGAIALVSCGGTNKGGGALFGPKSIGDCTHSPYEGEHATLSSFSKGLVNSGYFDKILPQHQLDALLGSSSSSIVSILKQQGVRVFQIIDDPNASCQYYSFLEPAPPEAQKNWKKQAASVSQPSPVAKSNLLGLFTTYFYRNSNTGKASLSDPVITLRHDTQKWTLLHEMTHYLFAQGRTNEHNMPFDDDLLKTLEGIGYRIKELEIQWNQNPSAELAHEMVEAFKQYHAIDNRLDAQQGLEEFTIESMLVERSQQGLISSIDKVNNYKNAYSYMHSNSNEIRDRYLKFIIKLNILKSKINIQDIVTNENQESLSELINKVQSTVAFIDNKLTAVQGLGRSLEPLANLPMGEGLVDLPINVHSHIDIELVEKQNQLFETIFN